MPLEPQITGMSPRRRLIFFWGLVCIFTLALPLMIFYTTGYRVDVFNADTPAIVTTGGVYISTLATEVEVYLDEEQVQRPRLFRSAYYIQNIDAGQRRVVVQGEGLQTWVKEIPVDARIVTEAAAFNLPELPRIRPITEFQTTTGEAVFFSSSTPAFLFAAATSTQNFIVSPTMRTSSYVINPEYEFVESLFSSSTATSSSVFAEFVRNMERFRFMSPDEQTATTSTTTEPLIRNNMELVPRELELFAVWRGQPQDVPYYFCVTDTSYATTSLRYGQHVADAVYKQLATTAASSTLVMVDSRICRTEIKLDRLRQDVFLYDFFPNSSDLVLIQLEDGLYVTEIDDRSWQNSQLLYPGNDIRVILENGVIYIKEDGNYFEIVPEIETN